MGKPSLTRRELIELETLLEQRRVMRLRKGLTVFNEKTSPNYKLLYECVNNQTWGLDQNGRPALIDGYTGAVLEGSSRSTKTWSGIDLIIYLGLIRHKDEAITINIYRQTYNEFKTTLYDDFKRRLHDFNIDNPFARIKEVGNFKIGKATIHFLGDGKFGGGCDYAFFNECMFIDKEVFRQVTMRCRKFWWMDYNPCFTDHWVFDSVIPRSDVVFLRTTFKDNPFISPNELNEILISEPWAPGSYEIRGHEIYCRGHLVTEFNQPPPHPVNVEQGTADEFYWKVFGLGLRGAMKGVIFDHIYFIDKFPDIGYTYANDFGFTADPNAFGRYAEQGDDVFVEVLIYRPIETARELAEEFTLLGVEKYLPIACDSSDKFTGEGRATVEMVKELNNVYGYPEAYKISKTKSVMFWLLSLRKKKIHFVTNEFKKAIVKEKENYKFKEVHGILINQPEDAYNHIFDMVRYGHMSHNEKRYEIHW